jgi:hypothetical protein
MVNRCAHRGAIVQRAIHGNARAHTCCYHQWSYDFTGRLINVPFQRGIGGKGGLPADFDKSCHGLQRLRVQTLSGVIFGSFSETVEPLEDFLGPVFADQVRRLFAAFTQEETTAMVREAHRLGRRVAVHVRGREGALYAARAGVDILYHASRIDDEGIRAAAGEGCSICPSLMLLVNNIEYAQPDDPSYDWWPNIQRRELADASRSLRHAYDAGIPFLSGSETGFAVTPYGEFSARELPNMMKYLGIDQGEILRIATSANRRMLRGGQDFDSLAPGKFADFVIFDGNPLNHIAQLEERERFSEIWMNGKKVALPDLPAEIPRHPCENAQGMWNRVYTRAATLRRKPEDAALRAQDYPDEFA